MELKNLELKVLSHPMKMEGGEGLVLWITTRQEKNLRTTKMYILRSAQKLKNHIFPLMTTFYSFTLKTKLKTKLSCAKKVVKSI